jgi:hypothetical protein
MKAVVAILCTLLLLTTSIYSKSGDLLISLGYNSVHYPFHNYTNKKSFGSYQLNSDFTLLLNNQFSYSTGLNYELKGFVVDFPNNNINGWAKKKEIFQFGYVVFPAFIEYNLNRTTTSILSIRAGLEIGSLLSKDKETIYYDGRKVSGFRGDYQINKFITTVSYGINYRHFLLKNYFVTINPMIRLNTTNGQGLWGNNLEGSAISYSLKIGIGIIIHSNTPSAIH